MSRVLIAVGGTGQEIALACLRLCHMAGIEPPWVIIIDSDTGASASEVSTRSDKIQQWATFLKNTRRQDCVVFLKPLRENIKERRVETLRSLFSPANLTPPKIQELLSVLFTTHQQETRVVDGFHGRPTVGSVAVEDYFLQGEFKEDFVDRIDELTKPDAPHFIVLAGSTTGGTGPGAIPPVSRKIMEWRKLHLDRHIEVSGVVQLQWFQPQKVDGVTWSQRPDVDLRRLQQNSACLVKQYGAELKDLFDRLVLLSLPKEILRVSAGPNHQPETLHWLNILSGWIVTELMYEGDTLKEKLKQGGIYGYALDAEKSPLDHFTFQRNKRHISLKQAVDATRVMAAFGTALNNQIGHGRLDPALPRETYRFLGAIRQLPRGDYALTSFLKAFSDYCGMDQAAINWFRDACASRFNPSDPGSDRDSRDIKQAFRLSMEQVTTDVRSAGKLLKQAKSLEQDIVALLLREANAHVEGSDHEATAVGLYRDLRAALLDKLL